MDLHIVPGITATGAAEAHRLDLLIQNQYNCNCMTYWVDESKNSAFCLIDAPNAEAVRELHNKAHGLMTHQIIEVNKTVVESFLGRIYDPETPEVLEEQLKVFNDSAFRVLIIIKISDPMLVAYKSGNADCEKLFTSYQNCIENKSKEFEGRIAEHKENITAIISFTSTFNAVACALAIQDFFSESEKELLDLKISVNAGMPVTHSDRIFGDTIDLAERLLYLAKPNRVIVASIIKEITHKNFFNLQRNNISSLSSSDEKLLDELINVLVENSSDEDFGGDDFCKHMALSKSSLNRATHALTGKTPNELLKEYRLNKAFQLLRKNPDNISQVAFTVGFRSPSYFSKCFKEYFKLPPSYFSDHLKS